MQTDSKKNNAESTSEELKIQWYAADKEDTSIISYGFFTKYFQPPDNKKGDDFKITYKKMQYLAYKKVGKKFEFLGKQNSLEAAQLICGKK